MLTQALVSAAVNLAIVALAATPLYGLVRRALVRKVREEATKVSSELITSLSRTLAGSRHTEGDHDFEEQIIAGLAPQRVVDTVLGKTYGNGRPTSEVTAAILGGHGNSTENGGLTVSTSTNVHFGLRARQNSNIYDHDLVVTHTFSETVNDRRFAIIMTCDAELWGNMLQACTLPLYESIFIPDPSIFDASVKQVMRTTEIGIKYSNSQGDYPVETRRQSVRLDHVGFDRWEECLRLFREPVGESPQLDKNDYTTKLRIYECDLNGLVPDDQSIGSVESLSMRLTTQLRIEDGFLFWQAPFPCYVEHVTFDASRFSCGDSAYEFRVVPFMLRSDVHAARWVPSQGLEPLAVHSWLLPGHGLALLWKKDDATG